MATMRDLMMIVERGNHPDLDMQLGESVEDVSVMGRKLQVMRNPSVTALLAASLRKSMRGLVDAKTGDTYWWNASQGVHYYVEIALGLRDPTQPKFTSTGNTNLILKGKAVEITSGYEAFIASSSIQALARGGMRIKKGVSGDTGSLEEFAEIFREKGIVPW